MNYKSNFSTIHIQLCQLMIYCNTEIEIIPLTRGQWIPTLLFCVRKVKLIDIYVLPKSHETSWQPLGPNLMFDQLLIEFFYTLIF